MQNKSKIFIHSIPRKTATGISDWTNDTSGRSLRKVKIGRCKDTYACLYSSKVGGLKNYVSYTPWLDNDGEQRKDNSGRLLTLQDKFEQEYGLPKGYLHNRPRQKSDSKNSVAPSYFQQLTLRLNDGGTVLDLNDFDDLMRYYMALESKFIANSEREFLDNKFPYATHYIAHINETDEIKYKKIRKKSEAFAALHDGVMTVPIKRKMVSILEMSSASLHLSEEQVHNLLFDYIDKSSSQPGSNISKFMGLYNLLKNKKGKETFEAKAFLKEALDNRVVYEKQGTYTWISPKDGEIVIGEKYDEAIEFILNPKKQSLVEDIEEQIKSRSV
jgi:hypothetical protein